MTTRFATYFLLLILSVPAFAFEITVRTAFSENLKSLKLPPMKGVKQVDNGGAFVIHASMQHHQTTGIAIQVWLTSTNAQGKVDSSQESAFCNDPARTGCFTMPPAKDEVQSVFDEALDRAMVKNAAGFGHYSIQECPKEQVAGTAWLTLRPKTLPVDFKNYRIADYDSTTNIVGVAKYYQILLEGLEGKAGRFRPSGENSLRDQTLSFLSDVCKARSFGNVVLVTQFRPPSVQVRGRSKNARNF